MTQDLELVSRALCRARRCLACFLRRFERVLRRAHGCCILVSGLEAFVALLLAFCKLFRKMIALFAEHAETFVCRRERFLTFALARATELDVFFEHSDGLLLLRELRLEPGSFGVEPFGRLPRFRRTLPEGAELAALFLDALVSGRRVFLPFRDGLGQAADVAGRAHEFLRDGGLARRETFAHRCAVLRALAQCRKFGGHAVHLLLERRALLALFLHGLLDGDNGGLRALFFGLGRARSRLGGRLFRFGALPLRLGLCAL